MDPAPRLTSFLWGILPSIDQGRRETVETVSGWIEDGSLFVELAGRYGSDLSMLDDEDRQQLLELFDALRTSVDARRKFGVSQDGLVLLAAYATEGLQQWAYKALR